MIKSWKMRSTMINEAWKGRHGSRRDGTTSERLIRTILSPAINLYSGINSSSRIAAYWNPPGRRFNLEFLSFNLFSLEAKRGPLHDLFNKSVALSELYESTVGNAKPNYRSVNSIVNMRNGWLLRCKGATEWNSEHRFLTPWPLVNPQMISLSLLVSRGPKTENTKWQMENICTSKIKISNHFTQNDRSEKNCIYNRHNFKIYSYDLIKLKRT